MSVSLVHFELLPAFFAMDFKWNRFFCICRRTFGTYKRHWRRLRQALLRHQFSLVYCRKASLQTEWRHDFLPERHFSIRTEIQQGRRNAYKIPALPAFWPQDKHGNIPLWSSIQLYRQKAADSRFNSRKLVLQFQSKIMPQKKNWKTFIILFT